MPSSANKDDRTAAGLPPAGPAKGAADASGPTGILRTAVPQGRIVLFAAIVLCGTALDLATKHWVFDRLGPLDQHHVMSIWPGYIELELSLNRGALFGFGQGYVLVFAGLSLLAAGGILYWLFVVGEARDLWLSIALALISAGICGNLYDRLGLPGLTATAREGSSEPPQRIYAVRDWILLRYGPYRWPNFNVADSLLVCGAGILLAQFCFTARRGARTP